MAKIAIVTDSNSGIGQEQAKSLGITILPMPFTVGEATFYEEITLTREQFYKQLKDKADISTSQPSPESVMNLWDELLKTYDEIVHIPMSSSLSGSCQTALMLANGYDGRIQVVNNQRISVTQRQSVLDALTLKEQGKNAAQIKAILEKEKLNSSIYITLDTLYYLKKGGRITAAAAALGTLLKIKPVLQIQGGKLDAFAKARTMAHAKTIMLNAIKSDAAERFGGLDPLRVSLSIAHSDNQAAAEAFREEVLAVFPGQDIAIGHLSLSVACHIGPGSLALACSKHLEDEK